MTKANCVESSTRCGDMEQWPRGRRSRLSDAATITAAMSHAVSDTSDCSGLLWALVSAITGNISTL